MSTRTRAFLAVVTAGLVLLPAATAAGDRGASPRRTGADAAAVLSAQVAPQLTPHKGDHDHPEGTFENSFVEAAHLAAESDESMPRAPEVPSGFQDTVAIGNLSEPVAVAFAPDGTAFIAQKTGVIKSFDYSPATDTFEPFATHTTFADLSTNVENYHDRGLTGIAVDPQFGTAGNNYIYVNYAYNRDPRDNPAIVPKWFADPGQQYDTCPAPAAMGPPVVTGCIINIRVTRIPAVKQANGWVASGPEQPLLEGACMQFGSHASGDVVFGPDGYLYASAGDGASFDTEDWGQANNPCGDPTNEGGSLRSQDLRTSGDPLGFSGSVVRINKANGNAANGSTDNADRIVAYGQRNPWRLAFRPGTSELWSGDVGGSIWEEINRLDMSTFSGPVNRGWPCYEGSLTGVQKQPGWDALDKPICENLYTAESAVPGTVKAPYFSYRTRGGGLLTPGENCQQGTSSISGVAFIPSTSDYPAAYRGSLFFNDYARGCIWRLGRLGNGDPDPASIIPFVQAADTPVGIEIGPGGDLYYVDYGIVNGVPTGGAGDIHRIVYTPTNQAPVAALTAGAPHGPSLLSVDFDASGSTDGDGDTLSFEWALDGDGVFNDGGGPTKTKTYPTAGPRTVQVRVSDGKGGADTAQVLVTPGNSAPTITSTSPSPTLTWAVGQTVSFSATATDAQQTLTDANYSWSLTIEHCPSVCHSHPVTTWTGQRTGTFTAPDHEYPSNLLLQLRVTDDQGLMDTKTIKLDPKSVPLTFASSPNGAALTVSGSGVTAPHDQIFIQGSNFNVTAPATRVINGANYTFTSWSDGGAATHAVVAPTSATTLTASYARQNRLPTVTVSADPTSGAAPLTVNFSTTATDPDGDNAGFTYEWALDGDGVFNDGGGATKQRQYTTVGPRTVQARVTDTHGGQATGSVTVHVGNQPPAAVITTTPSPASGPAPLQVAFSGAASTDPNPGDILTFDWDLDGNGTYETTDTSAPVKQFGIGSTTIGLRVTDNHGAVDTDTTSVTATNTAPTVSSVRVYPAGRFSVGQSLGFDAVATDAQQALPATAYTFVMQQQNCASGCPRREVQRWTGTMTGRFVVPALRYRSHLYLVAQVTDAQGAVGSREFRIDPRPVRLKVRTKGTGLWAKVDGVLRKDGWSRHLVAGSLVKLAAPKHQVRRGVRWTFVRWSDGGARRHEFRVWDPTVKVKAVYRRG